MSLRIILCPLLLIFIVSGEWACGSRKNQSGSPPDAPERLSRNQPEGQEDSGPVEAPTLVLSEAERRHCLEEQEKTLESWGWNRGRGVAGVIDLLLDETQQSGPLPRCTP